MAVMTQERLLRLLQKVKNVSFDYVIIDEAHSLLSKLCGYLFDGFGAENKTQYVPDKEAHY